MNQYLKSSPFSTKEDNDRSFALLSHDLRSALAGIIGSLDLMQTEDIATGSRANFNRAKASAQMLNELLDLAFGLEKPEPDTKDLNEPVNVKKEISILTDLWRPRAEASNLIFLVDLPESLPFVESRDKVSFHRIINNLIGNAIKFSESGEIRISARYSGGGTLTIAITDKGPGFSEAAMMRLFQFRGRPEDSDKPGSGMGLYIVNTLVKSMGGAICINNRVDGGAEILLTFPVAQNESEPEKEVKQPLPDLSPFKILLAEDNITNQFVLTQMLKTMGAEFEVAADGVEALEMFDKEDFDVVLLDIEMPRKSGLEVLREIRQRSDSKSAIPLVALTAYVMREHRERIEKAGADGIIAKPIDGISTLGHSILGYMYGGSTYSAPELAQKGGVSNLEENVGDIDIPIFDALMETIGAEARAEFLDKVRDDLEEMKASLIEAEVKGDISAIRAASHTLISVGGSIGATKLQRCAETLNQAVKTEGQKNRQSLNMQCIMGISEVLAFLADQ